MPLIEAALIKQKIPTTPLATSSTTGQDMKTAVAAIEYLLREAQEKALDLETLNRIRKELYAHHEEMNLRLALRLPAPTP